MLDLGLSPFRDECLSPLRKCKREQVAANIFRPGAGSTRRLLHHGKMPLTQKQLLLILLPPLIELEKVVDSHAADTVSTIIFYGKA